jgi:hypothetical protein
MKKQGSKKDSVWLGFDITTENGPSLRPQKIQFWKEDAYKSQAPEAPFHYFADALAGLALVHLNQDLKNPFIAPQMNYSFCHEAWMALEPHHELFMRSQTRVSSLRRHLKEIPQPVSEYFERNFTDILDSALHPWGVDLTHLEHLIEAIEYLETKMEMPLLYNFQLKFSKPVTEKLHYLHSLLFNLRGLIALDYNAHVQDAAHDAVKIDSITDYLSKAEYVANDAMLYHQFRNIKEKIPNPVADQLMRDFKQYSHNGYCLVESLPSSFLSQLPTSDLEEMLYIVQMDWLLGTDAGLLFKIREELYGLKEGYEKIFWPDVDGRPNQAQTHLSVSCELTLNDVFPSTKVA